MPILPSTAAGDIISYVRSRCRLGTAPPNAIFQTTQMLVALHDINEWFLYWPMDNGNMAPWKFTRRQKLFAPKNLTTLAAGASAGDVSLSLTSGTDFDSPVSDAAGAYLKNTNGIFSFFTYEGRAAGVLSGVTPLDIDFDSGTEVRKLYTLPDDYGRPRILKVNGTPYKFLDSDFDDVPGAGSYFTKYLDSTNHYDHFYLVLPLLVGSGVSVKLHYVKRSTVINEITDNIDAPDGVARWATIKKFEAYCWFHRGEMELSLAAETEATRLMNIFAASQSGEDAGPDQGPTFDLDDE